MGLFGPLTGMTRKEACLASLKSVTKEVAGAFAFLEPATGGTRRTAASRGKAEVRELGLLCGAVVFSACFGTKKRGVRGKWTESPSALTRSKICAKILAGILACGPIVR